MSDASAFRMQRNPATARHKDQVDQSDHIQRVPANKADAGEVK